MRSVRFSRKQNIYDKREKKQNFMTKPSQYPEKDTHLLRHIHHSTIVWLDSVYTALLEYASEVSGRFSSTRKGSAECCQNCDWPTFVFILKFSLFRNRMGGTSW